MSPPLYTALPHFPPNGSPNTPLSHHRRPGRAAQPTPPRHPQLVAVSTHSARWPARHARSWHAREQKRTARQRPHAWRRPPPPHTRRTRGGTRPPRASRGGPGARGRLRADLQRPTRRGAPPPRRRRRQGRTAPPPATCARRA
ncbi:hypothetical protein BU14_0427s0018 [Porphyra umbilicalis]|uniref:Uncharacterized protein n=1 Tax=Porphyra umbilicalis TaxID=2786 RepID=A0A1X6NV91_PORUM|nr:hypothetical protein BU14_0427s0018 [Porphyra umbilicalis]|eukprot:OSX72528.1 hypothetical protein BU14_0427s0018 [Porphyra umbilicalis]